MNTSTRRTPLFTAVLAGLLLTSITAFAETASLAARLPKAANAVLTVDVEKLIQSPIGKEIGLQSKLLSGYADRPLAVPATAKRVAIGALVHPGGIRSIWQTALIDLPNPPRLEPMLRAQGGYLDLIAGKQAAWTPRDTFFVVLDDHTLGVVRPGQRQLVTRWVSGKLEKGLSPYLSAALNAGANDVCVFAVDLDEVVGVTALKHAVGMGQLPSLMKIETGEDKLLAALASVTGTRFHVRATSRLDAEWIIDFEQDISALGSLAKPFVIDVLTHADLYEPDMDQWDFKVEGKRLVAKRVAELEGLNRLLALLSPAGAREADGATASSASDKPGAEPTPPAPANDPATASQKYYRAVSRMIDAIGSKPSPQQGATWLVAQARMIQQLPVMNVDPALLEWGNAVADVFTRAAQELAIGQQRAMTAAQSVQSPTAYTSHAEPGYTGSANAESRAALRNAQQQKQQLAQTERGAAAERAFAIVNTLAGSRGKIRADMTQKYGVEF
jgi:hypothetical protein